MKLPQKSHRLPILFLIFLNIVAGLSAPLDVQTRRQSRLSLAADWENYHEREPEGPGSYAFGYDIQDPETDNVQFRHEERHPNGTVRGSYGYITPDGNVNVVNYIADALGYRANVETRSRGDLKPIKVNVEQEITDAIADGGRTEDLSLRRQSDSDGRTVYRQAIYGAMNNHKDKNYVVDGNKLAKAIDGDKFYQFYYTPLLDLAKK